jgi:hypothetical protein
VIESWIKESLVLTKNCVGFSPPVSARAFAYFSIALHEVSVGLDPGLNSFSGRLNGFHRTNFPDKNKEYVLPEVLNHSAYRMATFLYENMPEENLKRIVFVRDSISKKNKKGQSKIGMTNSREYGALVSAEVFEWSKSDGGHQAYLKNYPKSYVAPACDSCWTRTPSSYLPAMLPYWGENRTLLESNSALDFQIKPIRFSTDTNSIMYMDCMEILTLTKKRDPKHEVIAEYWDDSPGVSGTPSGHLFSVAIQLVNLKDLSFSQTLQLYALLGVAVNDAFIQCWKYKFLYSMIRPTTYIQRYIDPQFNCFINTPPFPEFPSGHSFQSGAAESVFLSFFNNEIIFTDNTQSSRKDILGTPREFKSIVSMIEEISISRMYGGIHFRYTLKESLNYGRLLGENTTQQLLNTQ